MEKEVEKYYNKGLDALDDGNWLLAVQHFRKCLDVDPAFITARHELADIYFNNKQYEAALAEIKQALTVEPDDPEASFALGNIYMAQGRHKDEIGRAHV